MSEQDEREERGREIFRSVLGIAPPPGGLS